MIPQPPPLPQIQNLTPEIRNYLQVLDRWAQAVYSVLNKFDIGQIKISTGEDVPTGGTDGDLYVRVAGASTKLYLNINGTFSGFNNP